MNARNVNRCSRCLEGDHGRCTGSAGNVGCGCIHAAPVPQHTVPDGEPEPGALAWRDTLRASLIRAAVGYVAPGERDSVGLRRQAEQQAERLVDVMLPFVDAYCERLPGRPAADLEERLVRRLDSLDLVPGSTLRLTERAARRIAAIAVEEVSRVP